MAESHSKTQLPMPEIVGPRSRTEDRFRQGLDAGRDFAQLAVRRAAAWAEENPGQFLLVGLATGFVLGQLLFYRRRTASDRAAD